MGYSTYAHAKYIDSLLTQVIHEHILQVNDICLLRVNLKAEAHMTIRPFQHNIIVTLGTEEPQLN